MAALAAALLLAVLAPAALAQDGAIDIPNKKFVLDNGLTLVVHEDHKTPIVAVNIWYHDGSKNEKPGKTGFAHLFEHLMFNGSENADTDWFKVTEPLGATDMNGTTNEDRTNYFENVPKSALDTILWMESDRMGHLLGAVSQAKLDEQRGVVQNEKRQGENAPLGRIGNMLPGLTYPPGHPYSWSVIGSMEDLDAARLEDVRFLPALVCIDKFLVDKRSGSYKDANTFIRNDVVRPGEDFSVTIEVHNYKANPATNVVVTDHIPAGCSYVAGSANFPVQLNGDQLIWNFPNMKSLETVKITYKLKADAGAGSTTLWYDDVEVGEDNWEIDLAKGDQVWYRDEGYGVNQSYSWIAEEKEGISNDFFLYTKQPFQLNGNDPSLYFWHLHGDPVAEVILEVLGQVVLGLGLLDRHVHIFFIPGDKILGLHLFAGLDVGFVGVVNVAQLFGLGLAQHTKVGFVRAIDDLLGVFDAGLAKLIEQALDRRHGDLLGG